MSAHQAGDGAVGVDGVDDSARASAVGAVGSGSAALDAHLEVEHPWTVDDIGRNAITSIINDPSTAFRGGQRPLKGMDNLPPISPTPIKKVKNGDFDPYIRALADVFDRYQYNRAMGLATATEGMPVLSGVDERDSPSFTSLVEVTNRLIAADDASPRKRKGGLTQSQRTRMLSAHAPPLDTVLPVFFDAAFDLGNPATFAQVCENADFSRLTLADVGLTSSLLQDKLSLLLDTVDVHLIKEISRRSSSFFAALSTLEALHQETQACVDQIHALRARLSQLAAVGVDRGLEVSRLDTRRRNVGRLRDGVSRIAAVQAMRPMIRSMADQHDHLAALELIDEAWRELQGLHLVDSGTLQSPPQSPTATAAGGLDLRGVQAIERISAQLTEIFGSVEATLQEDFVARLLESIHTILDGIHPVRMLAPALADEPVSVWVSNIVELNNGTSSPGRPRPLQLADASDFPRLPRTDDLEGRLAPIVLSLLKTNKLGNALQAYKEALTREIKVSTRKVTVAYYPTLDLSPQATTPDKKDQQLQLAKQLKAMTFDSFFELLVHVYTVVLQILHQASATNVKLKRILLDAKEQNIQIGHINLTAEAEHPQSRPSSGRNRRPPLRRRDTFDDEDDDELGAVGGSNDSVASPATAPAPLIKKRSDSYASGDPALGSLNSLAASGATPASAAAGPPPALLQDAPLFAQLAGEADEVLRAASDLANARCAKLLAVRSDQNAQLNAKDFYRLLGATREFILGIETLSGHHAINLKAAMQSQARAYLAHFHLERSKQLAIVVENEQWVKAEVPIDFQEMTDAIVVAGKGTASSGLDLSPDAASPSVTASADSDTQSPAAQATTPDGGAAASASASEAQAPGKPPAVKMNAQLVVDGGRFFVTGCALLQIKMLTDYLHCIESIPSLTTEALYRILDILKIFNSKTCQVILGAGATKSAGLKNINAGHIALAAQSIGAILRLIPLVKAAIANQLPPKQHVLLADFDRLERDFGDHQNELYAKLVSIMNDRLSVQCSNLTALNWDSCGDDDLIPDGSCTTHMFTLVKETLTLHRVLVKYLDNKTLRRVFDDVYKSYNKRLDDELKKVDLFTSGGKNRLLMDVQYLINALTALDGIDGPGNHLEVVVNNIRIKDRRMMATHTGPPTPSSAASAGGGSTSGASAGAKAATGTSATGPQPSSRSSSLATAGGGAAGGATAATAATAASGGAARKGFAAFGKK
ncbi:hypothetical protein HK405_006444 [Cladochytrium tenue]|nr:hypothetical protein HK405_006444 [Cladochytrium tenue]